MQTAAAGTARENLRGKRVWLKHLWWALPVILLVMIVGGVYLNEVRHCRTFHATGDELFDRYARAVIARQGWRLFQSSDCTNPATLPDELLAEWEPDFGNDPRYWQLRYFCARFRHDTTIGDHYDWEDMATRDTDLRAALGHLETARERGVADAETLLLLYINARYSWGDRVAEELGFPESEFECNHEQVVAFNAEYETRITALLDEAVHLGFDECWPYWERGLLRLSWGEEAAAKQDLYTGNSELNVLPVSFPVSTVVRRHARYCEHGNDTLNGAILDAGLGADYLGLSQILRLKEAAKEQEVRLALGGAEELTDALHHTFCTMAVSGRTTGMHQQALAVCDYILAQDYLRLRASELNDDQLFILNEIISGYYRIQREEEIRATANYLEHPAFAQAVLDRRYPSPGLPAILTHCIQDHRPHGEDPRLDNPALKVDAYLLRYPWRYYRRLGEFWLEESSAKLYDSIFEYLDEADLTTGEKPEWWGPYPQFLD